MCFLKALLYLCLVSSSKIYSQSIVNVIHAKYFGFFLVKQKAKCRLKLQSLSFASLSPSLFENLELQLCAELSSLHGVVLWHGSSADESNVLRSMCSCQSPHLCGYCT